MGIFQTVEMGEELTVSSSQSKVCDLSWWMLSSSVPMSRRCHSALKLFLRMVLLRCRAWRVQIAPTCFLFLTAGLLPHCLQHHTVKGSTGGSQRCFVLKQGQLLSDVAEDLVPFW